MRGPQEDLDLVLAHNLLVAVDLSEAEGTGKKSVPAKVYLNGTNEVGVVGDDYVVVVDIKKS